MEYALEIRDVSKQYPGFSLDHINFALPTGCIMGLIGENGAGKSTTIKLILDLVKKDSGQIRVLGETLTTESRALKEKVGVVMDECNFPECMRIEEIGKMMKHCYRTWDADKFQRYQKKFGLSSGKRVKDCSRGVKMKLTIAVALSHDSRLLILDEATSGLDPIVRDEILDIFLDYIQDEKNSILISSHIISDLEKICDYITFLHEGKLIFSEEKSRLLETYSVLKCSGEELQAVDPAAIAGIRRNSFGVEALVRRSAVPEGLLQDAATIEDIMLYHVKKNDR